jgi:hypothetical protein
MNGIFFSFLFFLLAIGYGWWVADLLMMWLGVLGCFICAVYDAITAAQECWDKFNERMDALEKGILSQS